MGESANRTRGYEWAIVSAGPPGVPTLRGKCRTGDMIETPFAGMKGDGLWIFTRQPIDPDSTTAAVQTAQALGYDVRDLKRVIQRGCLYGAPPAPAPPAPLRAVIPPPAPPAPELEPPVVIVPESAKLEPPGPPPNVTRRFFFDLEQGDLALGRVIVGL